MLVFILFDRTLQELQLNRQEANVERGGEKELFNECNKSIVSGSGERLDNEDEVHPMNQEDNLRCTGGTNRQTCPKKVSFYFILKSRQASHKKSETLIKL